MAALLDSSPADFRPNHPRLRIYSKFLVVSVFLLIFKGALVTSNYAGLTVPDWPSSYGYNMFTFPYEKWVGGIFYEHFHRLMASGIGVLTVIAVFWIWLKEKRRSVRLLAYTALLAVILQGVLGGLTVRYGLPPQVSVAHGVLGQTFFCITILLAYWYSKEWTYREIPPSSAGNILYRLSVFCLALVFVQLILGAIMRHTHSGLAVLELPTIDGKWIPDFSDEMLSRINADRISRGMAPVSMFNVLIHVAHRFGAVVVSFAAIVLLFFTWKYQKLISPLLKRAGLYLSLAVLWQFCLGVLTIWSLRQPVLTSFHVVSGALLLGLTLLYVLRAYSTTCRVVDRSQ